MHYLQKIVIEPSYKKETGLWVKELMAGEIKVGDLVMSEVSLVKIPAGEVGGKHKHPRVEIFACLAGELKLSWFEGEMKREEIMETADGKLVAYVIPSGMPHAVRSVGQSSGFLLEYASEKQSNVQGVEGL